jgi:hypothetical protein
MPFGCTQVCYYVYWHDKTDKYTNVKIVFLHTIFHNCIMLWQIACKTYNFNFSEFVGFTVWIVY